MPSVSDMNGSDNPAAIEDGSVRIVKAAYVQGVRYLTLLHQYAYRVIMCWQQSS